MTKWASLKVLIGSGGGNLPQSSLEGIAAASKLEYRKDATKLMLMLTDQAPKVPPGTNRDAAVKDTANAVREANIDSLQVVGLRFDKDVYDPLLSAGTDKAGGKYFDLKDIVTGDEGLDGLLNQFGTRSRGCGHREKPWKRSRKSPRSQLSCRSSM